MSFYPASIPRCQHIKVNGTQCGSPALRRRRFCFFHHQWRQERISIGAKRARQGRAFDLPVLEDANAIQITLMQIMRLILRGQIDPKSAGLLLYALQTASVNLRHTQFEPTQTQIVLDPRDVPDTPLGEDQWNPDDFEDEEEEETEGEEEGEADEEASAAADSEPEAGQANQPRGGGCPHPPGRGVSCRGGSASTQANPRAASTQTPVAHDQRRTTNDRPPAEKKPADRWFAPDGTPVTGSKLDQLRMLTQFIDYIAPLPPGEKD